MAKRRVRAVNTTSTGSSGARRNVGLLGLAMLLLGLGLAVGSLVYRWQLSERADRLRDEGVSVTATIADRAGGGGRGSGIDRIKIYYMYGSAQYHTWIPCAGRSSSSSAPGSASSSLRPPAKAGR